MTLGQQMLDLHRVLATAWIQEKHSAADGHLVASCTEGWKQWTASVKKAQQRGGLFCAPQPTVVPCRSQGRQSGDLEIQCSIRVTVMSGRIVVRINKYSLFAKQTQLGKGKVRTAGNILCSFILTAAVLFQLLMCILCNVLVSMFQSPLPKR